MVPRDLDLTSVHLFMLRFFLSHRAYIGNCSFITGTEEFYLIFPKNIPQNRYFIDLLVFCFIFLKTTHCNEPKSFCPSAL